MYVYAFARWIINNNLFGKWLIGYINTKNTVCMHSIAINLCNRRMLASLIWSKNSIQRNINEFGELFLMQIWSNIAKMRLTN